MLFTLLTDSDTASGCGCRARLALDVSEGAEEPPPDDLNNEELEAYAEEYARSTALADFEDLSQEDLFSLSDVEELNAHGATNEDVDMH